MKHKIGRLVCFAAVAAGVSFTSSAYEDDFITSSDNVVEKLQADGKTVYVFTNVSAGTVGVTLKKPLCLVEYLLVGGGGAGGSSLSSGGGGGGGVVHCDESAVFTKDTRISFAVGKGGRSALARGDDTTFSMFGKSLTAYGSGGGAGWATPAQNTGASTGGEAGNNGWTTDPDETIDPAQGHRGGTAVRSVGGGGGGGYSEAGGNASSAGGGKGGAGYACLITGVRHVYGSGGGGGAGGNNAATLPGEGGEDSGGRGGHTVLKEGRNTDLDGESGKDGFGGGGGGAGHNNGLSVSKNAGLGGCGTVILSVRELADGEKGFVIASVPDQTYAFRPCEPELHVSGVDGTELGAADYDVEYFNNEGFGEGGARVVGKGAYAGVYGEAYFKIFSPRGGGSRDVYLLLGGANMSGRGAAMDAYVVDLAGIEMLNASGEWVAASEPIHFDSGAATGPAASFARILANSGESAATVSLVPCAVGNSTIASWEPGSGANYAAAVERARLALADGGGCIRAILWGHGEKEVAASPLDPDGYCAALGRIASALRADLNLFETIPFIVSTEVEAPGYSGYRNAVNFNKALRALPRSVVGCTVVEARDLIPNADRLTFRTEAVRTLGERYAAAFFDWERACAGRRMSVAFLEPQAVSDDDVVAPPVRVTDAETGLSVDPSAYAVAYRGNTSAGYGVAVVTGKGAYAGETAYAGFRIHRPVFAAPEASGLGDGSSWANAAAFNDAMALAGATNEVWLLAGTYLRTAEHLMASSCFVRGGYRGVAGELAANPYSVFDGQNTVDRLFYCGWQDAYVKVNSFVTAFRRCEFTRPKSQFFERRGDGRMEFVDCRFTKSTISSSGVFLGSGNMEGVFSRCEFSEVCHSNWNVNNGTCIAVANVTAALVEDTLFVSNGVACSAGWGTSGAQCSGGAGIAICAGANYDTPVDVRRCRFIANRGGGTGTDSVVLLRALSGRPSSVENCLFVGNEISGRQASRPDQSVSKTTGTLVISRNQVNITGCTFAYNLLDAWGSAAGITVSGGQANIKNTIAFGNIVSSGNTAASDLFVASGASVAANFCCFTDGTTNSCRAELEGALQLVECKFGDPLFVTSFATATNHIASTEKGAATDLPTRRPYYFGFAAATHSEVASFNCHLRGRGGYTDETTGRRMSGRGNSPALDTGDPDDDYSQEPKPNGKRVNMGFYGNTPWATCTSNPGLIISVR